MRAVAIILLFCISLYADLARDDDKNIVIDKEKNLIWQDDIAAIKLKRSWENAKAYCEKSNFAQYDDWRLPKKDELLFIVDLSKEIKLHSAFKHRSQFAYWSIDRPKSDLELAWRVNFSDGKAHWGGKRFAFHIRCVRDI